MRKRTLCVLALSGLFACSSQEHFGTAVVAAGRDGMGFVGTGRATERKDNMTSALGALNSLLAMRCQDGFAKSLHAPPKSRNHKLTGFFQ